MDKLQYDSLYKFLVSLGIVLIVLPIATLLYLFNMEPVIISQADFDALSEFSLHMIHNKAAITSTFAAYFPFFAFIFEISGLLILTIGIRYWMKVQNNLDKKLDAEAAIESFNWMKMNKEEIDEKLQQEATEAAEIETPPEPVRPNAEVRESVARKYYHIEDLCYEHFSSKYAGKYMFRRNIRMGRFSYDFIGVSKTDNVDLLFEIKYYRGIGNVARLKEMLAHLSEAGVNYEKIAHRNFHIIVALVTPRENLSKLKTQVDFYFAKLGEDISRIGGIEIQYFAEEDL